MPAAVHVHLQLRIVGDDGTVFTDSEILRLEKSDHRLVARHSDYDQLGSGYLVDFLRPASFPN
jgi:hypothetical protein